MERIALGIGLVIATTLATTITGCDDLSLPQQPDGGAGTNTSTSSSGAPPPTTGSPLMPAGALAGEGTVIEGVQVDNWVELDANGKISQLVWTMPLAAVNAVPPGANAWMLYGSKTHPEVAKQTGLKGVLYSYMPHGHIPQGVYDIPHWEFHVHYMTKEEFAAIDCKDRTMPPDQAVPKDWIMSNGDGELGCIPGAGYHCFNLKAPEFNGERFTRTFLTSYYGGQFGAFEPKISVELLKARKAYGGQNPPDMRFWSKSDVLVPLEFEMRYDEKSETYLGTMRNFQPGTKP